MKKNEITAIATTDQKIICRLESGGESNPLIMPAQELFL
jgi:hypothetical protein